MKLIPRMPQIKNRSKAILTVSLFVLVAAISIVGARTPDRLGPVYPITEPDWLEWLPQQAEKKLRAKPLTLSRKQLKQAIERQMPHKDFPEVKVPRTYYIDPTVKASQPVSDHTGKIVIPAGGRINPLEHLPGFRPIVILDASKTRQVEWIKKYITEENPLVLITKGDVRALSNRLGTPVYPAPEALLERFSIERVPVILSAERTMLKAEERVP